MKNFINVLTKVMLALTAVVGVLAILRYMEDKECHYIQVFNTDDDFEGDFY